MEVELRQVILCIETGCIICNYNGQLIFASSHWFAECSLLGACTILDLKRRRQPISYSAKRRIGKHSGCGRIISSNGLPRLCFGLRMLLYGVPFHALLPIFPANKRRGSDQYAESRRTSSAGSEQCRTSRTGGGGLNGSQFTEYRCPSASKILLGLPCMKCSPSAHIKWKISSIRYDHSNSDLRSMPLIAEDLSQHVFDQAKS